MGRASGDGVDVKLDDAKASRRHLRLIVGDTIEVEDLGMPTAPESTVGS